MSAGGHLWGYNQERGIFKTTDGGKTWKRLAGGLPTTIGRAAAIS